MWFRKVIKRTKRTAKKNHVEIFRVSSGEKKVKNALNILNKAVYNIRKGNHPKNKLNCGKCEFFRTEHCPWGLNGKKD